MMVVIEDTLKSYFKRKLVSVIWSGIRVIRDCILRLIFTLAVIIRTNGRIMAGILRTKEHSHAHRPISGASGLPLTSPRDPEVDRVKLNDLSTAIFDSTRFLSAFSGSLLTPPLYTRVYRIEELHYIRPSLGLFVVRGREVKFVFLMWISTAKVRISLIRTS